MEEKQSFIVPLQDLHQQEMNIKASS